MQNQITGRYWLYYDFYTVYRYPHEEKILIFTYKIIYKEQKDFESNNY